MSEKLQTKTGNIPFNHAVQALIDYIWGSHLVFNQYSSEKPSLLISSPQTLCTRAWRGGKSSAMPHFPPNVRGTSNSAQKNIFSPSLPFSIVLVVLQPVATNCYLSVPDLSLDNVNTAIQVAPKDIPKQIEK